MSVLQSKLLLLSPKSFPSANLHTRTHKPTHIAHDASDSHLSLLQYQRGGATAEVRKKQEIKAHDSQFGGQSGTAAFSLCVLGERGAGVDVMTLTASRMELDSAAAAVRFAEEG